MKESQKGFSLIELMIVVGLITLLSIIGGTSYVNYQARSRDARRRIDMQQIRSALELFRANNPQGLYPSNCEYNGDAACGGQSVLVRDAYLQALPRDPRRQPYLYFAQPPGCDGDPLTAAPNCVSYRLDSVFEIGGTQSVTPNSMN